MENNNMTNQELMSKAFYYINSFKRHRALENIARFDNNREKVQYHSLKQYQFIDNLELALRAIQKGARELDEGGDDN